jgi:hypothetical protein
MPLRTAHQLVDRRVPETSHHGFEFIERVASKEYARLMRKPTLIDFPYPTVAEVARTYGVSPTRRKQLERQVEEMLKRDAANGSKSQRRAAAKPRRASSKKK